MPVVPVLDESESNLGDGTRGNRVTFGLWMAGYAGERPAVCLVLILQGGPVEILGVRIMR